MKLKQDLNWAWWHVSLLSSTWEAEAGDCKFKASLGNIIRPYIKNKLGPKESYCDWYIRGMPGIGGDTSSAGQTMAVSPP
jgi:hypothetical protein